MSVVLGLFMEAKIKQGHRILNFGGLNLISNRLFPCQGERFKYFLKTPAIFAEILMKDNDRMISMSLYHLLLGRRTANALMGQTDRTDGRQTRPA